MQSPTSQPISVELVLATGSRSGMVAKIVNGYYMIGRHATCQIRPKTRSVSRRHCVVYREDDAFRVLDLESTSGTKINHEPIDPRIWYDLKDGDTLRCGKICFQVSMNSVAPAAKTQDEHPRTEATSVAMTAIAEPVNETAASHQLVTGEALQSFDVADFLESQDDADREERYEKIRESNAAAQSRNKLEHDSDEFDAVTIGSDDLDVYEDTPMEADENTSTNLDDAVQEAQSLRSESTEPAENRSGAQTDHAETGTQRAARPTRSRLPRIGLGERVASAFSGDADRMKLYAAIAVSIIVIGVFALQAFEFVNGPPVRVIEDLD